MRHFCKRYLWLMGTIICAIGLLGWVAPMAFAQTPPGNTPEPPTSSPPVVLTPTLTFTLTLTPTFTPTPTLTPTSTPTPSATPTVTPTVTPAPTLIPTETPTAMVTVISTATPEVGVGNIGSNAAVASRENAAGPGGAGSPWLVIGLVGAAGLLLLAVVLFFLGGVRRWSVGRKREPTAVPIRPSTPTAPLSPETAVPPGPAAETPTPRQTPAQPYLLSSDGRYFPLTTLPFTIGRDQSNNLIIDDTFPQWQTVSRRHAHIVLHPQGYVIEDQGSQNRLRVQGRLTERNLLRNGWKLHVGGVVFTFYDGTNKPGGAA